MGAAGMSPYLADLNNPALHDQAMGMLAQETNDALGGMDPKVLAQALEQMRQLKPQDLLQLLMLLDPAFESLRAETRFQRLQERARSHRQAERQRLEEYRQQGLVPRRAPGS